MLSLSGKRLKLLLMLAAIISFHAGASPTQPASVEGEAEPSIYAHGSGEPYSPNSNISKMIERMKREFLKMAELERSGQLAKLPPEEKKAVEDILVKRRDEIASVVREDEIKKKIEKADWVDGPNEVRLQEGIVLALPEGVRYLAPAEVAKVYGPESELSNPEVPVAIISAKDGRWEGKLVVKETGWVPADTSRFSDPKEALEDLRRRMHFNDMDRFRTSVDAQVMAMQNRIGLLWVVAPTYDPQARSLQWAHTNGGLLSGSKSVTFNLFRLGRRHVVALMVNSKDTFRPVDEILAYRPEFERVMARLSFTPGHHHDDYVAGKDAKSAMALEHFVFGPPSRIEQGMGAALERERERREEKKSQFAWKFVALAVFVVFILLARASSGSKS